MFNNLFKNFSILKKFLFINLLIFIIIGTFTIIYLSNVKPSLIKNKTAKHILITSQIRKDLIFNKNIKATNYQIDTYKKKIYVYGIALTSEEKDLVISEATEILDVENVVASILLVEDLRIQKE